MSCLPLCLIHLMSQQAVVSSPATGGFRGNGRKANLQERSYE